jgi:DNA-binding NarL/FixJ family response regulator
MPRVFIVEDHAAVRDGFRLLLRQEGMEVCGEAANLAEARGGIPAAAPDLVIVDLCLGPEDGMDLLAEFAQSAPDLPLLVVSMYEDAVHVSRAFQSGATGYLTKRETTDHLASAIRGCLASRWYLSPRAARGASGLDMR